MNWKDTVIDVGNKRYHCSTTEEILMEQAEISFKAGYTEGYAKGYKRGEADARGSRYAGMSNNEIFGHPC